MATKTASKKTAQHEVVETENKTHGTALAVMAQKTVTVGGVAYKIKPLSLPVSNPRINEPRIFRIDGPMHASKINGKSDADGARGSEGKPGTVCPVTDMESGEQMYWLLGALVSSRLEEYEGDYVGKIFAFQKLPKRPGKNYHDIQFAELIEE